MSQLLIQKYLNDLSDLRRVSGSKRESVVREAFKTLLKDWGRSEGYLFIPEYEHITGMGERRYIDGALVEPQLRLPVGYWEAKDTNDDLDKEIQKKFRRGYPQDNIIFEDTETAVLIQNRREVMRCTVDDSEQIERLVGQFFKFELEEIREFRKAVEQFKQDLPAVLAALRGTIEKAEAENSGFKKAAVKFLKHAQETINPSVTAADVREMLIQHILTEEIFNQVFDNSDFHRNNNVAKELYALEATFFTGGVRRETIDRLKPYYAAIRSAAALVFSHQEKQKFLKVIYENFYKVYNRKAADRLGVAYTPNEIVRFMIESADWLCQKHFGKRLIDKNVEILDPATGTGTFIADLLEHFRGQKDKLRYKYLEELHANEVAILPYYVANLNIEATFAAITGEYLEYPNLCFVDTLDNVAGLKKHAGEQMALFGAVSDENVARIKRQNKLKISVVIGNPPYNANQLNENENNKNRDYDVIDNRIESTYLAASNAQKTKLYDMYVRFFRWASDRLDDNGIVAFVSNSSFVHKPSFDGVRRELTKEFSDIYIVDLKGDARTSGERRKREGGNIFGDQIKVGIAISFLVRRSKSDNAEIHYDAVRDYAKANEKADSLTAAPIAERTFEQLRIDEHGNWISVAESGYSTLLPIATKETKAAGVASQERAIFKLYSLGISTNRDDWLYDLDYKSLIKKIKFLGSQYDKVDAKTKDFPDHIKWSETLKRRKHANRSEIFDEALIRRAAYRPFFEPWLYQSELYIDRPALADTFFPRTGSNSAICFSDIGSRTDICLLAVAGPTDLHFGAAVDGYQQVARYRFSANGVRADNITDWALEQFYNHYESGKKHKHAIDKDAIFHYVYGVLHDPVYREKYAQNLKREFPRIPFHADFWKWAVWGGRLMALHIGYEKVEPWKLKRVDTLDETAKKSGVAPKTILKAVKESGVIMLDSDTQLAGVPKEAWDYRLGNRSAL
ncbi:MAG TPA: type ISP restriction/modification enzyme, partial [Rhizomicrobium sp.]|nr:type ISP restriction/modification enzyme [Rhizomicrobium sp.]